MDAENAQEGRGLRMPDQRQITREIMRGWAPLSDARENGALQPRDEELDCAPHNPTTANTWG